MSFAYPRKTVVMDIECYRNYFLVAFRVTDSLKTRQFAVHCETEADDVGLSDAQMLEIRKILNNRRVVTFNGRNYDMPMLMLALAGATCDTLKEASDAIIVGLPGYNGGLKPWEFERHFDVTIPASIDHIDIMEVAPGEASLKIYAGRIHCKKMQDLPIEPSAWVTAAEADELANYCNNDTQNTLSLFNYLSEQITLRETMSDEFGIDLRSKSDAQIAEAVIAHEVERITGKRVYKPDNVGRVFRYTPPAFIEFNTPTLRDMLQVIRNTRFEVNVKTGAVVLPKELEGLEINIGTGVYRMGVGGLHSSESTVSYRTTDTHELVDRDVTSYYPAIILRCGLSPSHLGAPFLKVYGGIVNRRVRAKKHGDKVTDRTLKIVVNGSFGKLGSVWSKLYAPNLMVQVTVTGQLSLLMLIERLEDAGIRVVSANTDGVVSLVPVAKRGDFMRIMLDWEVDTGFNTEETRYSVLCSRDVNNYVAIKPCGEVKPKGVFADPGLQKNPQNIVCVDAVVEYLRHGTDMRATIEACTDIRKFVTIRQVRGGGEKDGHYLGKAVRWYYGIEAEGVITYCMNGNKVGRTNGAVPLMELPTGMPDDIDYDWYVREAYGMLDDAGLYAGRDHDSLFKRSRGFIYCRKPGFKTVHTFDLSTGATLCGTKLQDRHDKWIQYPDIPDDYKQCPRCRNLDV